MLIGVDYFTNWAEVEIIAKITVEWVHLFNWINIIYRFKLPKTNISENKTQLDSSSVIELCINLRVQMEFI